MYRIKVASHLTGFHQTCQKMWLLSICAIFLWISCQLVAVRVQYIGGNNLKDKFLYMI
uniref:Uncharacterized protein n=1 Tax=Timema poppense TaxID=170557 RepID=A0A7R9DLW2_TIMPO|nr:unnamed protein product [Timema poppensis]